MGEKKGMPELPEVETMRRDLSSLVVGDRVASIAVLRRSVVRGDPSSLVGAWRDRPIAAVSRRAKILVLDDGAGTGLALAPRMTGRPLVDTDPSEHPHDRLLLGLVSGRTLHWRDSRAFGRATLLRRDADGTWRDEDGADPFAALGPEPFDPGLAPLDYASLLYARGGERAIKAVLLDQSVVVGVGNIYADEACFAAGVHPASTTSAIPPERLEALARASTEIMAEAIEHRGTRVRDYASALGPGENQSNLRVFGRTGAPCPACHAPIEKIRCAGRGTHLCATCQVRYAHPPR